MADPLVSVVVSTFAGAAYLRGCLEMLLQQTIADRAEIIVIDSGSPEDEQSIVREFQQRFDNVRYVRSERETLYAAWNRGLDLSTGTFFANVNVDDWIRDDALEVLAGALERHPECGIAYADWATTDGPRRPVRDDDVVSRHGPYEPSLPLFYCYGGCVQFWRRAVLCDLGGFDPSFVACGDLEVLWRLTLARGRAVHVPEVLEGFYKNPDGLSHSTHVALREQFEIFARARRETPIDLLYDIDAGAPEEVADAWVALGNLAVTVRVPWHPAALGDVGFAVECYDRALEADPLCARAMHNRYVVLFQDRQFEAAERSLSGVSAAGASLIRGTSLGLSQPPVEPAVHGPVYEYPGQTRSSGTLGVWRDSPPPLVIELHNAKEYIASLEDHLAAERAETERLRAVLGA